MFWGYHLMLDCRACDIKAITDSHNIYNFVKRLVPAIDMVAYGEPNIVHFGEDNKAGYTLVQLIETSNINAHFCDDTGDAYIDVFSCKPFDEKVVKDHVEWFFKPEAMRVNFVTRQA